MSSSPSTALAGPIAVVGCGLMGTSVALALAEQGHHVFLSDVRAANVELAVSRGAGTAVEPETIALAIVAVPPAATVAAVADALTRWPEAVVTDLASVKSDLHTEISAMPGAERHVGSHPMAGSERSGPMAASSRLFEGRPWAITAQASHSAAAETVRALATAVGAVPIGMEPIAHDRAVALVSHVPYVLSVLTAARLNDAPGHDISLAGPGLRDVARVAASDPALWDDILTSNKTAVSEILRAVRGDLDQMIDHLSAGAPLAELLDAGRRGTALIPGKHGETPLELAAVFVPIDDAPGELSRLMTHTGESGVNIEDIRIDHELGRPVGLVEISVLVGQAETLVAALTERGWPAYL